MRAVDAERRRDEARARWRGGASGAAPSARRLARRAAALDPCAARATTRSRAARIASMPSSGSTARMSSAAGRPAGSVTMFRQSYIP